MGIVYLLGNGTFNFTPWWTDASATIECWGAGQAENSSSGTGGAGAGYAKKNTYSIASGTPIAVILGAPGLTTAQAGGDTNFAGGTVVANGGGSGTTRVGDTTNAGGAGGASSSVGTSGGGGAGNSTGVGQAGGGASSSGDGGSGGGGNGGGAAGTQANSSNGTAGGNGLNGTGGAGGTSGSPWGGVAGKGAGGGGGYGNGSSINYPGGNGGDDYDNGAGGAGGAGGAAAANVSGGLGGTPGGGGGGSAGASGPVTRGGYGEVKITSSVLSGTYFQTYGNFTSAMISPSFLTPFTPPNVAAPLAWNGTPSPTIQYVPSQSCNELFGAGPAGTYTVTGSNAVSNGNTICVFAAGISQTDGNPFSWVISDNAGNAYKAEGKATDANGMGYIWFFCPSSSGSPTQFTFDGGGDSIAYGSIIVDVFSGVNGSNYGVGNNSQFNPGSGTDDISCTAETTLSNGNLVWCVCLVDDNTTPGIVPGTGFTAGQSATGGYPLLYSEYKIGTGYSTPLATWTDATEGATGNNYYSTGSLEFAAA